jgi:Mrp family chromosome partitioning ATPase
MAPPDGTTTLIVRPASIDACQRPTDGPPRVVPVWATPSDESLVAMLGPGWPEATAALRVIRHRLELLRAEGMWTFGVTSARAAEGKTTLAAQLALVLSEADRARVLLVEASLRRPALARKFGIQVPPRLGFSAQIADRMAGGAQPWAVLALSPALHVLVEHDAEPGCAGALYTTHFRSAIERLGRSYDWVIVDAPHVLGSGDANVVEEAVDGMIVAARSGASRGVDLRAAVRQIGERKAVGVILWDAHR